MTHIENVPHILRFGVTHVSSKQANKNYKAIGDGSIITTRNDFELANGRKLGDYIPFYFGTRMPMLYVIQKGYNGVTQTSAEDIVYCASSVQKIVDLRLSFLFTDGHAIDGLTNIFGKGNICKINNLLDWRAIGVKYWVDEKDLDLKRRKEAEFLVAEDVPAEAILYWIVFNESSKKRLLEMGILSKDIQVKPQLYF